MIQTSVEQKQNTLVWVTFRTVEINDNLQ